MKNLIILTGAGISAESGIKTFRDSDGLWEEYEVTDVATPEAWERNMPLVLRFYNERRRQLGQVKPNAAHLGVAALEKFFNVQVITQNIDDLHERAGSTKVLHLHGQLTYARSSADPELLYHIGYKDINLGDKCEKGTQLRPHVVWFGEAVPAMDEAVKITESADIFAVIGSSLAVYPAAGLVGYTRDDIPLFIVDPKDVPVYMRRDIVVIKEKASKGIEMLIDKLLRFTSPHFTKESFTQNEF